MSSTTICMTDTSVVPFPTLDLTHAQNSTTAPGPLPHLQCRDARSSPFLSLSDNSNTSDISDTVGHARQGISSSYVRYDSGSSSSSSTPSDEIRPTIMPRSKHVPSQKSSAAGSRETFARAAPASTPASPKFAGRSFADLLNRKETPLRDTSDEEDVMRPFPVLRQAPFCKVGKLMLEGSAGKLSRHANSCVASSRTPTTATPSTKPSVQANRKRSGQPIKSSLKSTRRPELHVVTDGSFVKSEPVTPTHTKAVHFDAKLEHVKLFLAEQKPLAVSRDGSPTSDTSGDEFPSFVYGNGTHGIKQVKMLAPNMPSSPSKEDNVALQELVLSQDQLTITGNVRVRNIAYEKSVAVRFTLDWWQTTSEVTARYDKSVEGGAFDVFAFSIRLHDIWPRIEEKTIFVALRYTVAGKEYWDNNAGKNFHIKFVLVPPSGSSGAADNEDSLRDLNLKLEDVAKTRSAPISIFPYRLGRSFSADHQYSLFPKSSSRYDFASTYRTQRVGNASPPLNRHSRTHTYPSGVPTTAVVPWADSFKAHEAENIVSTPLSRPQSPPISPGSPREPMDGTSPAHSETKPALSDSPSPSRSPDLRERNHRRGYIDRTMQGSSNLRRTPTGSPLKPDATSKDNISAPLQRTWSYPFTGEKPGLVEGSSSRCSAPKPLSMQAVPVGDGRSKEPPPSKVLPSNSSDDASSSCTSTLSSVSPPQHDNGQGDVNYKQFLDQFCFYTGSDSWLQESSEAGAFSRSRTASGMERYLLSHSPPQSFSSSFGDLPTVRVL